MKVRMKNDKGSLLFEWNPETQTVDLIRKDMYYKIHLDGHLSIPASVTPVSGVLETATPANRKP